MFLFWSSKRTQVLYWNFGLIRIYRCFFNFCRKCTDFSPANSRKSSYKLRLTAILLILQSWEGQDLCDPNKQFKQTISALFVCFSRSALHFFMRKKITGHVPSLLGEPKALENKKKINKLSPFLLRSLQIHQQSLPRELLALSGAFPVHCYKEGAKPTCSNGEPQCYGGKNPSFNFVSNLGKNLIQ